MSLLFGLLMCMTIALWTELPKPAGTKRLIPLVSRIIGRRLRSFGRRRSAAKVSHATSIQFETVRGSQTVGLPSRKGHKKLIKNATKTPDNNKLDVELLRGDEDMRALWDNSIGPGPFIKDKRHDYTNDDEYQENPYLGWRNGKELAKTHHCRMPKLYRMHYPTCNPLHELGFTARLMSNRAKYVGGGDYRQVFAIDSGNDTHLEKFVFKEAVYEKDDGDFTKRAFEPYFMDGVVSAAITPHPLFVDFYAFCGLSMLSEYMGNGDIEEISVTQSDRCDPKPFGLGPHEPFVNKNDLTATEKLQFSLDMAEALALMHNHPMGVLVHDDVQPSQFLLSDRDRVKLNDFNRAEVMLFDEEHQQYCKYRNGKGPGDWRSPEEYRDDPLDELMDVFSLGNNIFSVLTGIYNFPRFCKYKPVQQAVKRGERSYLDPRFKDRSYGEGKLLDVINRTWAQETKDRATIGEVVVMLRQILKDHLEWEKQTAGRTKEDVELEEGKEEQ